MINILFGKIYRYIIFINYCCKYKYEKLIHIMECCIALGRIYICRM